MKEARRVRHATETELALFYDNKLNAEDAQYVSEHLASCSACSEVYELMRDPLNELEAGHIRRLSRRQFGRLWKRIVQEHREMKSAVDDESAPAGSGGDLAYAMGTPVYATTAPGSAVGDKPRAGVYDRDGHLKWLVRADSDFEVQDDGSIRARVKVVERVDELKDAEVVLELSNDLDRITMGPFRLEQGRDAYGPYLEAELRRPPEPRGGLSKAQLEGMRASVRLYKG